MKIMAGIVSYNPDINRLKENMTSVIGQVDKLIVFDNNSRNISLIEKICNTFSVDLIKCDTNKGVAYALKAIMSCAVEWAMDWVLTLDQDSIPCEDIISKYLMYINDKAIGALTCGFVDRNIDMHRIETVYTEATEVEQCITSGFFINVQAYTETKGYDEKLFIDLVDFDMCMSLREAGFKIVRLPFYGLTHEIGKGKNVNFLGREIVLFNHQPFRRYYMSRNLVYLSKKHPQYISFCNAIGRVLYRTIVVFIYEDNKIEKLIASLKGLLDGMKMESVILEGIDIYG